MNKAVFALICCTIVIIAAVVVIALILTFRRGSEPDDETHEFECGQRYVNLEPRLISNGSDAPLGSAPWFVSIHRKQFSVGKGIYKHACGGSIIAPEWMLTATHCISSPNDSFTTEPYCIENCIVIAGSIKREDRKENYSYGTVHKIVQQIPFDVNYTVFYGKDIALLKVSPPFEYRKPGREGRRAIGPVCLPNEEDELPTKGDIVGFGITNDTLLSIIKQPNNTRFPGSVDYVYQLPENLQTAHVNIISRDECAKVPDDFVPMLKNFSGWRDIFLDPKATICGGNRLEHQDTCKGDSGGPLTADINEEATIIGITSLGLTEYCIIEPVWYTVFVRVSHYRKWIKQMTGV